MRKNTVFFSAIIMLFSIILLPGKIYSQADNDTIKLTRYIYPAVITPGSTVTVTLVLYKGYRGGYAKLEEFIPHGFKAIAGDNNGANFTTADTMVNFEWVSMPEDPTFTVSYHLTVPAKTGENYSFSAQFTCLTRSGTTTRVFSPYTISIQNIEAKPKQIVVKEGKSTPIVNPVKVTNSVQVVKAASVIDTMPKTTATGVKNNPVPPVLNKSDSALQKLIESNNALISGKPAVAAQIKTTNIPNTAPPPAPPIKINNDLICFRVQIMATAEHITVDSVS